MADDGWTVQTSRSSRRNRDAGPLVRDPERRLASYEANPNVTRYTGTDAEYDKRHYGRYGVEEGLGHAGPHRGGYGGQGTDRKAMYDAYHSSNMTSNRARDDYHTQLNRAVGECNSFPDAERDYYDDHTGGLHPRHHATLSPVASTFADRSYSHATRREDFLAQHPYGFHSSGEQREHYGHGRTAYREYETALQAESRHRQYQDSSPYRAEPRSEPRYRY